MDGGSVTALIVEDRFQGFNYRAVYAPAVQFEVHQRRRQNGIREDFKERWGIFIFILECGH